MSILKDKFITNRTEKENINKKIKETHVQPTEQEQNTAQDIIRKVSEQYAEELISKDISDISNQIAATVREYCNQLDLTYEEQKRIENMIDFPGEYTADDFRSALDLCFKRSTEAEAFIRSLHDYTLRLKGVWHRWLGALRPAAIVRKP